MFSSALHGVWGRFSPFTSPCGAPSPICSGERWCLELLPGDIVELVEFGAPPNLFCSEMKGVTG